MDIRERSHNINQITVYLHNRVYKTIHLGHYHEAIEKAEQVKNALNGTKYEVEQRIYENIWKI